MLIGQNAPWGRGQIEESTAGRSINLIAYLFQFEALCVFQKMDSSTSSMPKGISVHEVLICFSCQVFTLSGPYLLHQPILNTFQGCCFFKAGIMSVQTGCYMVGICFFVIILDHPFKINTCSRKVTPFLALHYQKSMTPQLTNKSMENMFWMGETIESQCWNGWVTFFFCSTHS